MVHFSTIASFNVLGSNSGMNAGCIVEKYLSCSPMQKTLRFWASCSVFDLYSNDYLANAPCLPLRRSFHILWWSGKRQLVGEAKHASSSGPALQLFLWACWDYPPGNKRENKSGIQDKNRLKKQSSDSMSPFEALRMVLLLAGSLTLVRNHFFMPLFSTNSLPRRQLHQSSEVSIRVPITWKTLKKANIQKSNRVVSKHQCM